MGTSTMQTDVLFSRREIRGTVHVPPATVGGPIWVPPTVPDLMARMPHLIPSPAHGGTSNSKEIRMRRDEEED